MKTRVLFLLCFAIHQLNAQDVGILPLTNNAEIQAYLTNLGDDFFSNNQNEVLLDLPFIDDFSYNGIYPDATKWVDRDVFRNNTLAISPPSLGVVTFDGLDETGIPYDGGLGPSDHLTSQPINLSEYVNSQESVYFSFFIQSNGLSHSPRPVHNIKIEFKNIQEEWIVIEEILPFEEDNTAFEFKSYKIDNANEEYLYNGFQFRLVNTSDNDGLSDTWHVDYVLVDAYDSPPDGTLYDVAFVEPLKPILKIYSTMPWEQFDGYEGQELAPYIDVKVYNHFSGEIGQPILNTSFDLTELISETAIVPPESPWLSIDEATLAPNTLTNVPLFINEDPEINQNISNFIPVNVNDRANFQMDLSFHSPNESSPQSQLDNNSISSLTKFDNYYAYDDGTAEQVIALQDDGENSAPEAAVKFHANEATNLHAVRIHHPYSKFPTNDQEIKKKQFYLKIWIGELDDTPEYVSSLLDSPQGNTHNQFTTYILKDNFPDAPISIEIPENSDFYVGWEAIGLCVLNPQSTQPADWAYGCVVVGIDYNNPDADQYNYINRNSSNTDTWENIPIAPGALMIRPVVGDGFINNLSIDIAEEHTHCVLEVGGDKVVIDVSIAVENNFSLETCGATTTFYTTIQGVASADDKAHYSPTTGLYHGKACFNINDFNGYGDYILEIYAENGCGTVSDEITISIVPPVLLEANEIVCNNITTGTIEHVNDEIYSAISLHSGGVDFCSPGGDVLIKPSTVVEYVAKEFIKLYPGFNAASGSYFHAYIDELLEDDCDDNFQDNEDNTKLLTDNDDNRISASEKISLADEASHQNRLEIYPNPSYQHITVQYTIELEMVKNVELAIFNMQGQQVSTAKQVGALNTGMYQEQIDLTDYPPGVYFCQLSCDQFRWVKKVTKM